MLVRQSEIVSDNGRESREAVNPSSSTYCTSGGLLKWSQVELGMVSGPVGALEAELCAALLLCWERRTSYPLSAGAEPGAAGLALTVCV